MACLSDQARALLWPISYTLPYTAGVYVTQESAVTFNMNKELV